MYIDELRNFCNSKKGVTEHFPFDEVTLVFKVMNKMFALTGLDAVDFSVNLKCNPEKALELRDEYEGIKPGYHMNKKHWNTVDIDNDVPDSLIYEMINHSYELVVKGLKKADKEVLKNL